MSSPLRRAFSALISRLRGRRTLRPEDDHLFWSLDAPAYHAFDPAIPQRFRGIAIDVGEGRVGRLRVLFDDAVIGTFPVEVDRPDLAPHLAHRPCGTRCGYDLVLPAAGPTRTIAFDVLLDDGTEERLFEYDVEEAARSRALATRLAERMAGLPVPPPELVALTQGISDPDAYRDSILPGVLNLRKYLAAAGIDETSIRSVLDFGCGSGRLLAGWYLLSANRRLAGCDICDELVSWAAARFPDGVRILRNELAPPIPFGDGEFDLAFAASVFTHLSVPSQRAWQQELARVLGKDGILVVTLHGNLYVRLLFGDSTDDGRRFASLGHLEKGGPAEGSNAWSAFHGPEQAERVFDRFRLLAHFPAGRIDGRRILFPVAALQDVYVFRKR